MSKKKSIDNVLRQYGGYFSWKLAKASDSEMRQLQKYLGSDRPNKSLLKSKSRTELMQLLWEAIIYDYLITGGFSINSAIDNGPDFKVKSGTGTLNIEAIAPQIDNIIQKFKEDEGLETGVIPTQYTTDRWLRGVKDKSAKYQKYLDQAVVSINDVNVIAISNYCIEGNPFLSFYVDPINNIPHVLECLYPIDSFLRRIDGSVGYRGELIGKRGIAMQSGLFLFEENASVSAVLAYDRHATNWVLVHNVLARNPLPREFFNVQQEWIFEGDVKGQSEFSLRDIRQAN